MSEQCGRCRELGISQVAHYAASVLAGKRRPAMCRWHYRNERHPKEPEYVGRAPVDVKASDDWEDVASDDTVEPVAIEVSSGAEAGGTPPVQRESVPLEVTVRSEPIPNCGCGRPFNHRGRCVFRRQVQPDKKRPALSQPEMVCEVCDKSFNPRRQDQKVCSPRCRQRAYMKRKVQPDERKEPVTKHQPISPAQRERVIQLYKENKQTYTEIAAEMGLSMGKVSRIAKQAGLLGTRFLQPGAVVVAPPPAVPARSLEELEQQLVQQLEAVRTVRALLGTGGN